MKIEINTNEILGDETTIREEVIEQIADAFKTEMRKSANELIRETLEGALVQTVKDKVAELVALHLDTEFTEVGTYGKVGKTTTMRNKIADILSDQCKFVKTHYSSDQNAFTSAVMAAVEEEMKRFRKEYTSMVTAQVVKECVDEAAAKLKKAMGL